MHLEGTTIIRAPRQVVWEFLTDPTKVAQCAPGVESVNVLEVGKRFQATAAIGFGSVKARFTGEAEFLEMDIPNRAKIKAHGNATGSAADVMSEMVLSDGPDGATDLKWSADVAVVGQIASLAARLMTPISQKLTGLFFDEVRKRIEAPAAPAAGLAEYYAWLEDTWGFRREVIRTDYQFESVGAAAAQAEFFFGPELAEKIRAHGWARLPEWTGVWHRPASPEAAPASGAA